MPSIYSNVHASVTMSDNGEPVEIVFPAVIGDGEDDGITQAQADLLLRIRASEQEYFLVENDEATESTAPKTKKPSKKKDPEPQNPPQNITANGTGTGLDGLPIPIV